LILEYKRTSELNKFLSTQLQREKSSVARLAGELQTAQQALQVRLWLFVVI